MSSVSTLAEVHGIPFESLTLKTGTWGMIRRSVEQYPNREALVILHQPWNLYPNLFSSRIYAAECGEEEQQKREGDLLRCPSSVYRPCLRLTYKQLFDASHLIAGYLQSTGFSKGSTLFVCLGNQMEFFLLWWACLRMGGIFVPINILSLSRKEDLQHYIHVSKPHTICVKDETAAQIIDELDVGFVQQKILVNSLSLDKSEWSSLPEIIESKLCNKSTQDLDGHPDDPATMLFTSGTTGLPKPVLLTNLGQSGSEAYFIRNPWILENHIVNCCNVLPLHHIFGFYSNFFGWFSGGCITYPSLTFDVEATLYTLASEKCNWFSFVPAIATSLTSHYSTKEYAPHIDLAISITGGANVTKAVIERFQKTFRVKWVAIGFGLTECIPCAGWEYGKPERSKGVGTAQAGCHLRIIDPESRQVLKRNEPGELCVSGPMAIKQYGNGQSPESFIQEQDKNGIMRTWFRTGDYAKIDTDDNLYIESRIKDIIIRGGENLSAPRIEGVIEEIDSISTAQVIGIADEKSGEVPIAIVEYANDAAKVNELEIYRHVLTKLGVESTPVRAIPLQALGLKQWPMTLSRKVQKRNLVEPVQRYVNSIAQNKTTVEVEEEIVTLSVVRQVWTNIVPMFARLEEEEEGTLALVSSIEIIAFIGAIRKKMGKTMTIQMLQAHPSMKMQAQLLDSLPSTSDTSNISALNFQTLDSEELQESQLGTLSSRFPYNDIKARVTSVIQNIDPSLNWTDVESILPMNPLSRSWQASRRPRGNCHRHEFKIDSSVYQLQQSLRTALKETPMFRCIGMPLSKDCDVFVNLKAVEHVFELVIDTITTRSVKDLQCLKIKDEDENIQPPGLLTHFTIVNVQDCPDTCGLMFWAHHSMFDFQSLRAFCHRLDRFVGPAPRHPPAVFLDQHFGPFAHYISSLAGSEKARKDVEYHVKELKGIGKMTRSWPPQRSPEWLRGCDSGWRDPNTGELLTGRVSLGGDTKTSQAGFFGHRAKAIKVDFSLFRAQHCHIFPAMLTKAALVAFNLAETGSKDIVLGQLENGRNATLDLPSTVDLQKVDGPVMEILASRFHIDVTQITVLELTELVQENQLELMQHAHASIDDITASMERGDYGATREDATAFHQALRRQNFNWFSDIEDAALTNIHRMRFGSHTDFGVQWSIAPRKNNVLWLSMAYDFCQLTPEEASRAASRFLSATQWFSNPKNAYLKVSQCNFDSTDVYQMG